MDTAVRVASPAPTPVTVTLLSGFTAIAAIFSSLIDHVNVRSVALIGITTALNVAECLSAREPSPYSRLAAEAGDIVSSPGLITGLTPPVEAALNRILSTRMP
ncbi:hypothetical protein D3C80_1422320 [compost metagenome]